MVIAGIVIVGDIFPRKISFLPGMRYYAGNWDTTLWCRANLAGTTCRCTYFLFRLSARPTPTRPATMRAQGRGVPPAYGGELDNRTLATESHAGATVTVASRRRGCDCPEAELRAGPYFSRSGDEVSQ